MTFPAPVPEIPAANVDKAAAYYVNTLGFTFDWGDDQGVCDAQGEIQQFSFFGVIILTYVYVRIGGALCLSPSPPSNSNVPAS